MIDVCIRLFACAIGKTSVDVESHVSDTILAFIVVRCDPHGMTVFAVPFKSNAYNDRYAVS